MAGRYTTPPKTASWQNERELAKQSNGREFKMRHFGILCLAIIGASILSFPVAAQQKTVKACQEEWRANKADNQANDITEKAYVAQCRRGGSAARTAPARASSTSSAAPAGTQKTVKACQAEWRANNADNQAKGITEKAYVAQCRAGSSAASPTPAPAASTSSQSTVAAPAATQKTVKACRDEWRANKADNQAKGITEKAYVESCRGGSSPKGSAYAKCSAHCDGDANGCQSICDRSTGQAALRFRNGRLGQSRL